MKKLTVPRCSLLVFALLLAVTACGPSLVIQDVDYSQPLESVLTPNTNNQVHDQRYAIRFTITPILEAEGVSQVEEVRLIRDRLGYYYVTAAGFNNVYVLEPGESELKLKREIEITEGGVGQPAFNQRDNHIELVDRAAGSTWSINHNGQVE